jgi:aminoglycoside 2'-N-acetyltransferase I
VEIRVAAEAELPVELLGQVRALEEQAWPRASPEVAHGHDPELHPVSVVLLDGEWVVASLSVLSKDLEHAGQRYLASGLSAVVVDERRRGQGLGRQLVSAARAYLAGSGVDLAIFTCDRPLQAFYESAGFIALAGSVIVGGTSDQPFASDHAGFDKVTMAAFFSAVAVRGSSAFSGARIELYPGLRDRLW